MGGEMKSKWWQLTVFSVVGCVALGSTFTSALAKTQSTKNSKPIVAKYCKEETSLGSLLSCTAKKAAGEPVKIGMINTETAPIGAFPELTAATKTAVRWINAELGGVGGRPIELITCDTKFSPEGSQSCSQKMVDAKVSAVAGGIDIYADTGLKILEDNAIPYVGGIPAAFGQVKSPISFQFSGGTWGAGVAFADYAVKTLKAKNIGIMYADFGSIKNAAIEYSADIAKKLGAKNIETVPFAITATDFLAPLTAANSGNPDAIFVFAADTACVPVMRASQELGIQAKMLLVGACATPKSTTEAGVGSEGKLFNIEGPISGGGDPDTVMYTSVVKKYGQGLDPIGAGTVSFRAMMNLWVVMSNLKEKGTEPQAIIDAFRASKDAPSFMGHPYTCDGKQIPEFPALCSPQQIMVRYANKKLVQASKGTPSNPYGWIDVPAILKKVS